MQEESTWVRQLSELTCFLSGKVALNTHRRTILLASPEAAETMHAMRLSRLHFGNVGSHCNDARVGCVANILISAEPVLQKHATRAVHSRKKSNALLVRVASLG